VPGFQNFAAGGIEVRGRVERQLAIDVISGGRSDEPIDVGTLELKLDAGIVRNVAVGQLAPAFDIKTLDNKRLNLADFRGKFVLLEFWATWCGPCRENEPFLKAVHAAFGKDGRFVLIGLSLDDAVEAPRRHVASEGLKWLQGFVGQHSRAALDYGVTSIPQIMLFGPDGKIIATGLNGRSIEAVVAQALARRP
jgi:thiol-disulfide isomerase/thioredoxin